MTTEPSSQAQEVRIVAYGLSKPEGDDASIGVIQSNALEIEDDFRDLYSSMKGDKTILEPRFNLKQVRRLTPQNDAIQRCVVDKAITNVRSGEARLAVERQHWGRSGRSPIHLQAAWR